MPAIINAATVVLRAGLPLLLGLLCAQVMALNFPLPGFDRVMPSLTLIAVFYWTIQQPGAMNVVIAFVIGLWQDLIGSGPVGLNALTFVLVQWLILGQRHIFYAQPFLVGWWGFLFVAMAVVLFQTFVVALWHATLPETAPVIVHAMLTIVAYPLLAGIFDWLRRGVYGSR